MKFSRNSLLLTAGLFAMAAAIVFHAWWPGYKSGKDREMAVAECVENLNEVNGPSESRVQVFSRERLCLGIYCETFECK